MKFEENYWIKIKEEEIYIHIVKLILCNYRRNLSEIGEVKMTRFLEELSVKTQIVLWRSFTTENTLWVKKFRILDSREILCHF